MAHNLKADRRAQYIGFLLSFWSSWSPANPIGFWSKVLISHVVSPSLNPSKSILDIPGKYIGSKSRTAYECHLILFRLENKSIVTCWVMCCFWVLEISEGPPSWFPGCELPVSPESWLEFGELFWSLTANPFGILTLVPPLLSLNGKHCKLSKSNLGSKSIYVDWGILTPGTLPSRRGRRLRREKEINEVKNATWVSLLRAKKGSYIK